MYIYKKSNLMPGEKSMLIRGPMLTYSHTETMPWFTKDRVLFAMTKNWDFDSFNIRVNKILWDSEYNWTVLDTVDCERLILDMYNLRDLDDLVGYLFRASTDGYTIRYVSTDNLTGIYLERSKDHSTNIDEDVISTLVEVVKSAVEDRKPRWHDEAKGGWQG